MSYDYELGISFDRILTGIGDFAEGLSQGLRGVVYRNGLPPGVVQVPPRLVGPISTPLEIPYDVLKEGCTPTPGTSEVCVSMLYGMRTTYWLLGAGGLLLVLVVARRR